MENLVMYDQLSSYYSDKKVFVTGHTGFKGAWLTACLYQLGATVKGYALAPEYKSGIFSLLAPLHVCQSTIHDIRDKEILKEEINSFQPDCIFHLAAQPLVRRSYKIPAETFDINVVGTANLLEAVISLDKKCTVVVITTDKVYQNKEQDILYNEQDTLGGFDPYSSSKACAELVVNSFRNSFFNGSNYGIHGKAIASARAGNVIGGGDWSEDRIIPDLIRFLRQDQTIEVRNPGAVRPWQHVVEPIYGYLLLGKLLNEQPEKFSKAYNFGPQANDHVTVRQLVETATRLWGNGSWKDTSDSKQPHEAGLLRLDIHLAMKELGWMPKLNTVQAIEWTMAWYKKPLEEQADFTFRQIKEYFSL
jgi:CDP-glucose 4,6-dehydratase